MSTNFEGTVVLTLLRLSLAKRILILRISYAI
jgi:hypothetical protein